MESSKYSTSKQILFRGNLSTQGTSLTSAHKASSYAFGMNSYHNYGKEFETIPEQSDLKLERGLSSANE